MRAGRKGRGEELEADKVRAGDAEYHLSPAPHEILAYWHCLTGLFTLACIQPRVVEQ
jgi:hypothetical protein